MNRNFRLTNTRDFDRTHREGQTKRHKIAVLVYSKNQLGKTRVGVVASKKIGNAVKRNYIKRKLRSSISHFWPNIKTGFDLIFYARKAGLDASYNDWLDAIRELLESENLIIDE